MISLNLFGVGKINSIRSLFSDNWIFNLLFLLVFRSVRRLAFEIDLLNVLEHIV